MTQTKVFIQKQNGEWLNENCLSSAHGFRALNFDVVGFEMAELDNLELTKQTIVHGGINTVRKSFDLLKVKQPLIHNPHTYLPEFCKRNFKEITLGYVRNEDYKLPIFIKPLEDHKLFTGFVIKNKFLDLIKLKKLSDDVKILTSDYVKFVTEYRCFILDKKLVGCKNYLGDFKILPDFDLIEATINAYNDQPIAYSLDFAVTDKGETQLIEINDGFALGQYGLSPIIYCNMIMRRWDEIMKNNL